MDFGTIILSIVSALAGSGLMYVFINPRAAKEKPEIENEQAKANTEATMVASLNASLEELRASNTHFMEINSAREEKIQELRKALTECEKDLAISTSWVCKMGSCGLRQPCRGAGEKWIQELKIGESVPDYTPIAYDDCQIKQEKLEE